MFPLTRLFLAMGACFFLCQCQLINLALRLWPYLLLVENDGKKTHPQGEGVTVRGQEIEARGAHAPFHVKQMGDSAIVLRR